ncbi:MAG: hypothetical protein JOZ08_24755 [Verrucomicrobia bacterium]|nr:hypothetical protein [Verrucomicrobiota bacterium]MBV8279096.1 hypothetical protein [Verrucomicrobiota bacterium]
MNLNHECWESLCDSDQALLLEKRVAAYETEVKRLKKLLTKAAEAVDFDHCPTGPVEGCEICPLLKELRRLRAGESWAFEWRTF